MRKIALFAILLFFVVNLPAQTKWTNTSDAITWLNKQIGKVVQNDLTITQSFETEAKNNHYSKVFISSVNASGKSTTERYEFYIEHLNPQTFVVNVSGKSLTVKLSTQNQSKVIKYYKGDVFSSFVNNMEIYFDDIQMARDGIDALTLINEKTPSSQVAFKSKEQAYDWLKSNVKESREGTIIQNTIEVLTDQSNKFIITAKETDDKGTVSESKYEFYLTDFNPNSFQIQSKGTRLGLSFTADGKLKPVKYFQNGVQKNYTNKFEIYGTDPLNMMQIHHALQYLAGGGPSNSISANKSDVSTVDSKSQSGNVAQSSASAEVQKPVIKLDVKKLPVPEYTLRPYWLTDKNTLEEVERVDAQIDVKVKGMGYGGAEYFYTAFSPKSLVGFSKNQLPILVFRTEGGVDPLEIISLVKGEVKSDRRRFIQGSMKMGGKARNVNSAFVDIRVEKLKDNIFQIILPDDIESGEYAFMPTTTSSTNTKVKIACFRIE